MKIVQICETVCNAGLCILWDIVPPVCSCVSLIFNYFKETNTEVYQCDDEEINNVRYDLSHAGPYNCDHIEKTISSAPSWGFKQNANLTYTTDLHPLPT